MEVRVPQEEVEEDEEEEERGSGPSPSAIERPRSIDVAATSSSMYPSYRCQNMVLYLLVEERIGSSLFFSADRSISLFRLFLSLSLSLSALILTSASIESSCFVSRIIDSPEFCGCG